MQNPSKLFDVIVVGGGIAGLAAAMQAAFENKSVLLLEGSDKPGGQGGSTNRILNLFGFPEGISGPDLIALAIEHCNKYGVEYRAGMQAIRLDKNDDGTFTIVCEDRTSYRGRTVILACGLKQKYLGVTGEDRYVGTGVIHSFPTINHKVWDGRKIVVAGGGNSGAQCCLFLSQCECEVDFLVRAPALSAMSASYVSKFDGSVLPKNLRLHLSSEIKEIRGDGQRVTGVVISSPSGERLHPADDVIVMVGAIPHTAWLDPSLMLSPHGFIYTDRDLPVDRWLLKARKPYAKETEVPGIFAVGDVRFGNEFRRAQNAANEGMEAAASAVRHLFDLDFMQKDGLKLVKAAS